MIELSKVHDSEFSRIADWYDLGIRAGHFTELGAPTLKYIECICKGIVEIRREINLAPEVHKFESYAVRDDRQLVGFIAIRAASKDDPTREIAVLLIAPEARSKGIGKIALDLACAQIFTKHDEAMARCLPSSKAMQHILQLKGFQVTSRTQTNITTWKIQKIKVSPANN